MRNLLVVVLAVLAVGLAACHDGADDHQSQLPTVDSLTGAQDPHWGETECVDYNGCGDSIWLNVRLGEMNTKACALRLCNGQSVHESECMYNCPTARLLARCQ